MSHKNLLIAGAIAAILGSGQAVAALATPSFSWEPQSYSFVEVNIDGRGSYKDLVQLNDQVEIKIDWVTHYGDAAKTYKVYFDDELVNEGNLSGGNQGTITFPYFKSGRHNMTLEFCDGATCTTSSVKPIVIADTDGSHLAPLDMNIDANNKTYAKKDNTVVGAYFVEWGIYGRKYDVSKIPAGNLTHLLYGFIPICGPNESLKEIENGKSYRALQIACAGSEDYEVVVHDPWAAFQVTLPGVAQGEPIRGTYAQLMALKQRYPDLKILPSVGGWTLSDPFFSFTDKANRDTFVASMEKFLRTWKFYDGIDIDWEFPGGDGANPNLGDPQNDGQAYVALMQELRVMLDGLEAEFGKPYELTSAIGTGVDKIEDVNYGEAAQYMDYIFAMTYDFFGGWNNVTGHQTAIYCGESISLDHCEGTGVDENGKAREYPAYTIDNAAQALLQQGVDPGKIVLGTAMYGRGWQGVLPQNTTDGNPMTAPASGKLQGTSSVGIWEAGVIDYKGLQKNMIGAAGNGVNGFETGYDEQAQAAYVWNQSTGELVTYDSPRSVNAKGQYVRDNGFAGLFAWEIDADNGDILNAMNEGLADGGVITPPSNHKPVVQLERSYTVNAGDTLRMTANASDQDNDRLTYQWSLDAALSTSAKNTPVLSLNAPNVAVDTTYIVQLAVSDGTATTNRSATVIVLAPTATNTAPVLAEMPNVSVHADNVVSVHANATDAESDNLTYNWNVPAGLTRQGSGANISLLAGGVQEETHYTVSVIVSDGQASDATAFTVTVKAADDGGNSGGNTGNTGNTWDASKVYTGSEVVSYNGTEYQAKWWTKGNQPSAGGPWAEVVPDDGQVRSWSAGRVYLGGDEVSHNGEVYQAKWWTKNNQPGANAVWVKQ